MLLMTEQTTFFNDRAKAESVAEVNNQNDEGDSYVVRAVGELYFAVDVYNDGELVFTL